MNYLILNYFFMVYICSRRVAGNTGQKTHYDIDDFINQLLASQKFDELADKVADKAIKKLKGLDSGVAFLDKITSSVQHPNGELPHRYQEKKREIIPEDLPIKEPREPRAAAINPDYTKLGKINTQALLKPDDELSPSESLRLKYKYLKQHAQGKQTNNDKHFGSEEGKPVWVNIENSDEKMKQKGPHDDERNHHSMQISDEKNNNFETPSATYKKEREKYTRGDENEGLKSMFSIEHDDMRDRHSPNDHDNRNIAYERGRDKLEGRSSPTYEQNVKPQFKSEQREKKSLQQKGVVKEPVPHPVIDLDEIDERDINKNIAQDELPKIVEDANRHEFNEEPADNRGPDEDDIWKDNHKDFDEDNSDEDDKNRNMENAANFRSQNGDTTTKKRIIRKEGNRLYTYNSGPEYAEFRDELEKLAKRESDQSDIK